MLIEMVVESVRVNLQTYQRVVVLKEKASDRYLPIWIGNNEADAIVIQLQSVPVPRPQTHDLLKAVVSQLGAKITRVVVNDLTDDVFFAQVTIEIQGRTIDVDSRPSDAIALAVRVQAPIFAEESVLEQAGVALDVQATENRPSITEPGAPEGPPHERAPKERDEELKKLSAFKDFIDTLNLDDLGKSEGGKQP